jgi:hypothetical protein
MVYWHFPYGRKANPLFPLTASFLLSWTIPLCDSSKQTTKGAIHLRNFFTILFTPWYHRRSSSHLQHTLAFSTSQVPPSKTTIAPQLSCLNCQNLSSILLRFRTCKHTKHEQNSQSHSVLFAIQNFAASARSPLGHLFLSFGGSLTSAALFSWSRFHTILIANSSRHPSQCRRSLTNLLTKSSAPVGRLRVVQDVEDVVHPIQPKFLLLL